MIPAGCGLGLTGRAKGGFRTAIPDCVKSLESPCNKVFRRFFEFRRKSEGSENLLFLYASAGWPANV
ncbi:hypothetical protein BGLA2_940018 [Burkholderia gladioli]|nr:hypothetical protein BGLA2_940018 [Burkholderia gladioli]